MEQIEDANHLRMLSIAFYAASVLAAIVGSFFLIHVTLGIVFLVSPPVSGNGEPFPAELFGAIFLTVGACIVLLGWTLAACMYVTARSLVRRRRYYFCIVVSALCCLSFPLGTILGVLSLMVLTRESVKFAFLNQVVPPSGLAAPPPRGAWQMDDETRRPGA